MWILTPEGMYSIVKPQPTDPIFKRHGQTGDLAIRSRDEQDLINLRENWLPEMGEIVSYPNRDYPFRAYAQPDDIARAWSRIFFTLDWTNFKDEVKAKQGPQRAAIYGRVWSTLLAIESPAGGQGSLDFGRYDDVYDDQFDFDDWSPGPPDDIAEVHPELFAEYSAQEVASKPRGRFRTAAVALRQARADRRDH